jgi:hypothetical protein
MSNYSDDPADCRVDFYKPSGKWYTTERISFAGLYDKSPNDALRVALKAQIGGRLVGMFAVCAEPYVKNPFPTMVQIAGPTE